MSINQVIKLAIVAAASTFCIGCKTAAPSSSAELSATSPVPTETELLTYIEQKLPEGEQEYATDDTPRREWLGRFQESLTLYKLSKLNPKKVVTLLFGEDQGPLGYQHDSVVEFVTLTMKAGYTVITDRYLGYSSAVQSVFRKDVSTSKAGHLVKLAYWTGNLSVVPNEGVDSIFDSQEVQLKALGYGSVIVSFDNKTLTKKLKSMNKTVHEFSSLVSAHSQLKLPNVEPNSPFVAWPDSSGVVLSQSRAVAKDDLKALSEMVQYADRKIKLDEIGFVASQF